ncbi:MAG: hypothetical protein INE96_11315 [Phenylobacterium sp.]|nr:hypothetical protein [Phenylobacterium sp.]
MAPRATPARRAAARAPTRIRMMGERKACDDSPSMRNARSPVRSIGTVEAAALWRDAIHLTGGLL